MWNIVIGVIFVIGGLAGKLALRGTDSSLGIVAVGAILMIYGFVQMNSGDGRSSTSAAKRRTSARRGSGSGSSYAPSGTSHAAAGNVDPEDNAASHLDDLSR